MTFAGPDLVAGTVALVAQPTPDKDPGGGKGEDFGKSSPVGLLVVLLLLLAVVFLVRSMTKHLKRVPESFDEPGSPAADDPGADDAAPDGAPDPDGDTDDDTDGGGDKETAPPSNGKDAPDAGDTPGARGGNGATKS
jgi:hypothetical protein